MSQSCRHHPPCNCRPNASETIVRIVDLQVKGHIQSCLQKYMSFEEIVTYLKNEHQIYPPITRTVWEKLVRYNPDFFKAYNLRCETLRQIKIFNSLLEQQATLMLEHGVFDLTNLPPAIVNLLNQDPELQTRIMQNLANTLSHRSDVSPQSFPLPDLNYPIDQLQFPDDQQPEEHHDHQQEQDFAFPIIADMEQDPSTPQFTTENITEEAPAENTTEEAPTGNITEKASMGNITEEASMGSITEEAQTGNITEEAPTRNITKEASMDCKMQKLAMD